MSPTRRTILRSSALVAVGVVAGCLTSGRAPTAGNDPTPDGGTPLPDGGDGNGGAGGRDGNGGDAGGTRPEGTGGPGVLIIDRDEPPAVPVRPSIEVTEDVATTDHPPQFRMTLTNESDESISVGEGRAAVFAYVADESGALVLLPAGESYPAEAGCWRLDEPIAITEEYRTVSLDPGESVAQELALYGAAGEDACLPVGEHRFETTISVAAGAEQVPDSGSSVQWGFSILLE